MEQAKGRHKPTQRQTSFVKTDWLLQEVTFAALEERTDPGARPGQLVEVCFKAKKGVRR